MAVGFQPPVPARTPLSCGWVRGRMQQCFIIQCWYLFKFWCSETVTLRFPPTSSWYFFCCWVKNPSWCLFVMDRWIKFTLGNHLQWLQWPSCSTWQASIPKLDNWENDQINRKKNQVKVILLVTLGSIRMKIMSPNFTALCAEDSYVFSGMWAQAVKQGILQSPAPLTAFLKWPCTSCSLIYCSVLLLYSHHSQDSLFGLSIWTASQTKLFQNVLWNCSYCFVALPGRCEVLSTWISTSWCRCVSAYGHMQPYGPPRKPALSERCYCKQVSACHRCSSHLIKSQMKEEGKILKEETRSELELISLK